MDKTTLPISIDHKQYRIHRRKRNIAFKADRLSYKLKHLAIHVLTKLPDVQHLDLDLQIYNEVTNPNIESLFRTLASNGTNLRSLRLNIGTLKMLANHAIIIIGKNLYKWRHSLQHLELQARDCFVFSDLDMQVLCEELSKGFTKLQYLELDLLNCRNMLTDQTMRYVGEAISMGLPNIQGLKIWIGSLGTVAPSNMHVFCSTIGSIIKNLRTLDLYFWDSIAITDDLLEALGQALTSSNCLLSYNTESISLSPII